MTKESAAQIPYYDRTPLVYARGEPIIYLGRDLAGGSIFEIPYGTKIVVSGTATADLIRSSLLESQFNPYVYLLGVGITLDVEFIRERFSTVSYKRKYIN